jgi:hypothetical protein
MTDYPFDQDHLARTAELLYDHVPEFHKRADRLAEAASPPRPADLRNLVEALAAPLAALRQSVEELYGDLFVESAGEDMLSDLAASIALDLVFRDPEANRRDLLNAMARRRRKGVPAMLEEMARSLIDRQVATREGWKAVLIAQDLDIPRLERTTPDLRPASVADRAAGPLATLARVLDGRPVSARSGHAHPRHMIHWAFIGSFHPLARAACRRLDDGAADLRFAFDPTNAWRPLAVRSTGIDDRPGTDRVPEGLFAESPGDWHGQEGRFTVRLTGMPAAAARPRVAAPRAAGRIRAAVALGEAPVAFALLATDGARTTGPVEIELFAAPLVSGLPNMAAATSCGHITLDRTGVVSTGGGAGAMTGAPVLLLRLRPEAPATSRILGETVIAVTGGAQAALLAAVDPDLAASGYRRGALLLRIPEMRVTGERWLYIGADGSLHDASLGASGAPDRPLDGNALPARAVIAAPVGPAWPQAGESAVRAPFAPPLAAPGAAPVPVHGLSVLDETMGSNLPGDVRAALVFALTYFAADRVFEPMLRLTWAGPDPRDAVWEALDASADSLAAGAVAKRFEELAGRLTEGRADLALALRFECDRADAVLTPGEIAFTAADGRAVLIHLPQLTASELAEAGATGDGHWPSLLERHSEAVQVGADGSTWRAGTNILLRRSLGPEAPLLAPVHLRRREPAWRRLCPWRNEAPPGAVLAPTAPGRLDIDPRFGLFAMAASEAPVPHPDGPTPPPPPVTVDMQLGATMPIGALPVDRDRILNRAPRRPTRIVAASGHLGSAMTSDLLALPFHRSLAEAFAAIASNGADEEVVRVVDSGLYPAEALAWPAGPRSLVVEAAAGERPVLEVASSTPGMARYDRLDLSGFALLSGQPALDMVLPPAQSVELAFLSVLSPDLRLAPRLAEAAGAERLAIRRAALGRLHLAEAGSIVVEDAILDAGDATEVALEAILAQLEMNRATVIGRIDIEEVDISDAILAGQVFARERFRGCIRYSLLAPQSETPRKHKVVILAAASVPFLSRGRRDPAYLRLDPVGDPRVLAGASDGGEMGAFNGARLGELLAGLGRRLAEHTPAGMRTGVAPRH